MGDMERLLISNSELIVTKVDANNKRRLKFPERAVNRGCLSDEGTDWQLDISPVFHHSRGSDGRQGKWRRRNSDCETPPTDEIVITPAVSFCVATLSKEEPEGESGSTALVKKEPKTDVDDDEEEEEKHHSLRNQQDNKRKRQQQNNHNSREQVVYPCKVCGITFSSPKYVEQHAKWCRGSRARINRVTNRHHSNTSSTNNNNNNNRAETSSVSSVLRGNRQPNPAGGGDKKRYKCSYCDYSTDVSSHLTAHSRRHTGERPYACHLCHYRASEACTLTRHKMAHAGHKPYSCPSCQYRASFPGDLAKHMRTHTGEKPFACSVCPYRAARPGSLREHSMTHTGQRPHSCSHCPYRALSKAHLNKHLKTHHPTHEDEEGYEEEEECGFPCYVCGKQDSPDLASLTLHIQTQHPHLVSLYDPKS